MHCPALESCNILSVILRAGDPPLMSVYRKLSNSEIPADNVEQRKLEYAGSFECFRAERFLFSSMFSAVSEQNV